MLDPSTCVNCNHYAMESAPIDQLTTPEDVGDWLEQCELLCRDCPHCEPAAL